MKKSLLKIAGSAICMFLAGVSAVSGQTFEVDNIFYNVTSDQQQTVEVASGRYSGDVVIPSYVTNESTTYTVTGIGMGAFAENGNLTGITLPPTLTTIGNSAFYACLGIKEITIPESVTYIGIQAFISCANLNTIDIPAAVETIGSDAFLGCTGLKSINVNANNKNYTSVDGVMFNKDQTTLIKYPASKGGSYTIPSTVKTIETNGFFGAGSLTGVTIPEGVETINGFAFCGTGLRSVSLPASLKGTLGANAFRDCQFLSDVQIQPNSIEVIGESAFYHAISLQSITIPEGVTKTGTYAFELSALREIKLPSTFKELGAGTFSQCSSFSNINLPDGVETIGEQAFYGCYSLRAILLPKELKTIGTRAFEGCSGIYTINIPAATTTIGASAFNECSGLTSITVDEANQSFSAVDGILYDKKHTSILMCPAGISGDIVIPEGVTDLGEAVFSGCYGMTGVTLPNTIVNIDFMAFYNCQGLQKVFIPAGVKSIGNTAFGNCYSLNTIICAVPEPLSLQEYTFTGIGTWGVNLYVPEASVEAYKSAPIWSGFIVQAAEEGMIPGDENGVETIIPVEIEYVDGAAYDLSGKMVTPDTKGVVIRRAVMQDGSVKMVKVLNK